MTDPKPTEITQRSRVELVLVVSLCSLVAAVAAMAVKLIMQGDATQQRVEKNTTELESINDKLGALVSDRVTASGLNAFLRDFEEANPDIKVPRVIRW